MNPPEISDLDYIDFLITMSKVCSATETAWAQLKNLRALAYARKTIVSST